MTEGAAKTMIIDAHQHYWMIRRGDYGWLTPKSGPLLYQDYMPERLKPELRQCGVAGTIVVQAAPTMEETEFLLDLCEQEKTLLGVVGWLDVSGEDFERHFARFRSHSRFVGIRPHFPDVQDGDWSRYPQLVRNLSLLAEDGFPVDLLVRATGLPAMVKLLERVPKLAAVINHLAKPDIAGKLIDPWAQWMEAAARFEHVSCKLSGLATETGGVPWQKADFAPYVKHALDVFGAERILFGSDWPVCLQAGSFPDMLEAMRMALPADLTCSEADAIFGGNAARVYRLPI